MKEERKKYKDYIRVRDKIWMWEEGRSNKDRKVGQKYKDTTERDRRSTPDTFETDEQKPVKLERHKSLRETQIHRWDRDTSFVGPPCSIGNVSSNYMHHRHTHRSPPAVPC